MQSAQAGTKSKTQQASSAFNAPAELAEQAMISFTGRVRHGAGSNQRATGALLSAALLAMAACPARAADLLLIGGQGDDVNIEGIAIRTPPWKSWTSVHHWQYALSNEYQLGMWRGRDTAAASDRQLFDGSVTSVLTMRAPSRMSWTPYAEIGFGAHLISRTSINAVDADREFSTAFQFGEFLGVGAVVGAREQYSLAARIQHVSNGGIQRPNDGITFAEVVMRYRF
jgi:hypothetical protein